MARDQAQRKPCYAKLALMRQFRALNRACSKRWGAGLGPYQGRSRDANGQFEIKTGPSPMPWSPPTRHALLFRVMAQAMAEAPGLAGELRAKALPPAQAAAAPTCTTPLWTPKAAYTPFTDPSAVELGLSPLA